MSAIRSFLKELKEENRKPPTPHGVAFFSHILKHAKEFDSFDPVDSQHLAEAEKCEQKRCFENCQRLALKLNTLKYFEGYIDCGHVTEHAWLVDQNGVVFDPTTALCPDLTKHVKGYMGVEIPTEFIADDLLDETRWESLLEKYVSQRKSPL